MSNAELRIAVVSGAVLFPVGSLSGRVSGFDFGVLPVFRYSPLNLFSG